MLDFQAVNAGFFLILHFQCGDGLPRIAGHMAQFVQCAVITFGDIAALAFVCWRAFDQGAGEQVNELAMAFYLGQFAI